MEHNNNWSELSGHLLTLITDKLTFIKDYIRFGATCVNWHSVFLENRHLLPRQLPMLMISAKHDHKKQTRSFYSLSEKRLYDLQLPVTHNLRCCGSSFGWLFIVEKKSLKVRLLNPFFSQINNNNEIHLPSLNSLQIHSIATDMVDKAVLSANPASTSDYVVMIIYGEFSRLGFIKSGDKAWTSIQWELQVYEDVIYHKGQFYVVLNRGQIVACDISSSSPSPKQIQVAPSLPRKYWTEKKYIVESSGELLVVRRDVDFIGVVDEVEEVGFVSTYITVGFGVFKFDPIGWKWVEVKSLCGRMLFLGDNSSMSLLASDFPRCRPNCIYFADDGTDLYFYKPPVGQRDIGVFNLENGSFERHYPMVFPAEYPMIVPPPIWVEPTLHGCCK